MSKKIKIASVLVAIIVTALIFKFVKNNFFLDKEFASIFNTKNKSSPEFRVTTYQSIKLGAKSDEVLYLNGEPEDLLNYDEISIHKQIKKLAEKYHGSINWDLTEWEFKEKISNSKTYNTWIYYDKELANMTTVFYDAKNKVKDIGCYSELQDEKHCEIYGVFIGMMEDDVKKKLGEPSGEVYDKTTKILNYNNLNLKILFEKRRVYYISLGENL